MSFIFILFPLLLQLNFIFPNSFFSLYFPNLLSLDLLVLPPHFFPLFSDPLTLNLTASWLHSRICCVAKGLWVKFNCLLVGFFCSITGCYFYSTKSSSSSSFYEFFLSIIRPTGWPVATSLKLF
jgi:hypothetical protein